MKKSDIFFTTLIVGIICFITLLFGVINYWDNNGIYVDTDEPMNHELNKLEMTYDIPIEVRGRIKYRGDYIVSRDTIVEFCEVKATKKQMRKDMKLIWKQMKEGCK